LLAWHSRMMSVLVLSTTPLAGWMLSLAHIYYT
jgi:hypothetical protein